MRKRHRRYRDSRPRPPVRSERIVASAAERSLSSSNSLLKNPSFDESGVIHCGHELVATPERAPPLCRRWIASPFGCLFGFLCVTSAPVRGWVIEGGSLAGKDSSSASSRFASSWPSAPWSWLSCSWELLRFAIPQSTGNCGRWQKLSHRSYHVKTRILLSASQPFWTRLRTYAHCPFRAGPRDYSASRGSFEQASSVGIGLGIMAWPGGKFAVIHGVQLPAHLLGRPPGRC
jgi:hypothetical protein